jgi:hypothetical protein
MKTLVLYTGTNGFCANLISIIRAIEYAKQKSFHLKICCDYGMYGDYSHFFDFGLEFISDIPPGFETDPDDENFVYAHPDWDHGSHKSLDLFEEINGFPVSFERKREIALSFKPKIRIPQTEVDKYDAIHVRRGDALTFGQGAHYHHAIEYLQKTNCRDVFVMTGDFRVISEIPDSVKIFHIVPPDENGWWGCPASVTSRDQPIFMFQSPCVKYKNTVRLIIEMYTAARSETFVHQFSNVSEFIKLIHKNPERCVSL